jgi:CRISPR-associated protein Cas1
MTTLYLTEPRTLIKKDGDTLVAHIPENKDKGTAKRKVRVPLLKVSQVVVYGDVTLTSPAMTALLDQGVDICFCSYYGRFKGRLAPPFGKNSLIRVAQHQAHGDPVRAFTLAQSFVQSKLVNMRVMLLRANRKRNDDAITQATEQLAHTITQVEALEPETNIF